MAKYTDEQIKTGAECCLGTKVCSGCPFYEEDVYCRKVLAQSIFDLFNRKEADIEELKKTLNATIAGQETLQKYIPIAKSEAIKEFWNQRPPMLNPNFKGKEQYNKGWNDCISFFAEEYKILLGIEKRNENDCPDTAEEMVGESK